MTINGTKVVHGWQSETSFWRVFNCKLGKCAERNVAIIMAAVLPIMDYGRNWDGEIRSVSRADETDKAAFVQKDIVGKNRDTASSKP